MQQRQLRLGDILDDYCPRERRLANYTVVAMVGDEVRLTRCTTCDTEHPYKGGKVPRQRKKSLAKTAYEEVLESVKKESDIPGISVTQAAAEPAVETTEPVGAAAAAGEPTPAETPEDEVRLHRPLIRASLPRVDAQPAARPIPEFTIRQSRSGKFQNSRAVRFAKGRGGQSGGNQGNFRGAGGRQQGQYGHSSGRPGQHNGHSGRKRSR